MGKVSRVTCGLAIAATLGYCWAIWWFTGLFGVIAPHHGGAYLAPMLSIVLAAPIPGTYALHAIHWQILALVSLGIALKLTFASTHAGLADHSSAPPLLGHMFYLFLISCLHLVGLLASVVAVAHVIP